MRVTLCLCVLVLAGCSSNKEQSGEPPAISTERPESPDVKEFKVAVRKFIAQSRVAQNAQDRYASDEDIKGFCKTARAAYFAIPKVPGEIRFDDGIMDDAMVISIRLDFGGLNRLFIKDELKALEEKLSRIK